MGSLQLATLAEASLQKIKSEKKWNKIIHIKIHNKVKYLFTAWEND